MRFKLTRVVAAGATQIVKWFLWFPVSLPYGEYKEFRWLETAHIVQVYGGTYWYNKRFATQEEIANWGVNDEVARRNP